VTVSGQRDQVKPNGKKQVNLTCRAPASGHRFRLVISHRYPRAAAWPGPRHRPRGHASPGCADGGARL